VDAEQRVGHGGQAKDGRARLVFENPWLLDVIDDGQPVAAMRKKAARTSGGFGLDEGDDDDEDFGQDVVEAARPEDFAGDIFRHLAAARAEAADCFDDEQFRVKPLGGLWTATTLNVAQDAWQGRAVTAEAKAWCQRYSFQVAMRFDISLYTNAGALTCAMYWCQKLSCYYRIWAEAGGPDGHVYSDAEIASFVEPREFNELVGACRAPVAQRRFLQLRGLMPLGDVAK
jgi:hypothetical protein